jgi:RNA polymerase sigma-70 factor, ECF subfamily
LENRTSGAEALSDRILYGTAEAVPFVQRVFSAACKARTYSTAAGGPSGADSGLEATYDLHFASQCKAPFIQVRVCSMLKASLRPQTWHSNSRTSLLEVPMSIPSKDLATTPGPTAPAKAPNQHLRRNAPIAGEADAIQKAQAGDAASFEMLYALHKRRVYSLCLRMLGNVAEAEDLTQEAFLQLYRKIGTFRGDSAFSTWLHRLAVNVVLMHLRKKGLPQVSLEETLEPSQEDGPRKDIGARDLTLSGSVDRVTLERAIENLPPGYRLVFVLHDVEGYEHNEIAGMLECSIGNSKSQLHKARMKLRDLLKSGQRKEAVL